MSSNPWSDVDGIGDRQPAFCPYCGESPAFGGLGRVDSDMYRHHCPECDQEFLTVLPE